MTKNCWKSPKKKRKSVNLPEITTLTNILWSRSDGNMPGNHVALTLIILLSTSSCLSKHANSTLNLKQFYGEVVLNKSHKCEAELRKGNEVRVSGSSCREVPKYLNKNWRIDTLVISYTYVKIIKERTFDNLWNLTALEIDNNPIIQLEDRSFYGLVNLKNLSLSYNSFESLPLHVFDGLINLSNLCLKKTLITSFHYISNALAPSVVPSIKTLDMTLTILGDLREEDVRPMSGSTLEELNLKVCGLVFLDVNIFKHLKELKKLRLLGNKQLTPENVFEIAKYVKGTKISSLDLSKLKFKAIPTDVLKLFANDSSIVELTLMKYESTVLQRKVFPYLPKLTSLIMDRNKVRRTEPDAFDNIPNLESLSMQNSFFPGVPESIKSLTSLKDLNLAGKGKYINHFSVNSFNFSENTVLTNVDLSRNKIDTIDKNSFIGAFSVQKLTMISCNISTITKGAFRQMPNLRVLILTHNPLTNVIDVSSGYILPSISHLRYLSISRSNTKANFKYANSEPFGHMKELEELDMSEVGIDHFYGNLFPGLDNLRVLNLRKNLLSDWSEDVFSALSNLSFIDLSSNVITGKTSKFTEHLEKLQTKTTVDLSFNPFSCDCESDEFLNWIKKTPVSLLGFHTYETYSNYVCESPGTSLISTETAPCLISTLNIGIISVLSITSFLTILVIIFILILRYRPRGSISKAWFHLTIKSSKSNSTFQYDAFISYCSTDFEWINQKLLPSLEDEMSSMKLCVYERDFLPGREISTCILESIAQSRKILLILTNHFIKSQWCLWEMHMAQYILVEDKRDDLIIILLEDLDKRNIEPMLQYLITTRIYLKWSNDKKQQEIFWTKLRAIVCGTTNSAYNNL